MFLIICSSAHIHIKTFARIFFPVLAFADKFYDKQEINLMQRLILLLVGFVLSWFWACIIQDVDFFFNCRSGNNNKYNFLPSTLLTYNKVTIGIGFKCSKEQRRYQGFQQTAMYVSDERIVGGTYNVLSENQNLILAEMEKNEKSVKSLLPVDLCFFFVFFLLFT